MSFLIEYNEELKGILNNLAYEFYLLHGYEAKEGFDFTKSQHPQEKLMFIMAETAYDFFIDNDVI